MDYSAEDFREICAKSVEDLTAATADWVEKKVKDIPTQEEMLVNVASFRRTLCITLEKSGRQEVMGAIQKLEARNKIQSASPNYIYENVAASAADYVNDPYVAQQWGLDAINIEDAWEVTTGNPSVLVGVMDSGIERSADLLGRLYYHDEYYTFHRDFTDDANAGQYPDGKPEKLYQSDMSGNMLSDVSTVGHGTKVAGIIGAQGNNGQGMTGVAQNIRLVSLKVVDENFGESTNAARLIRAINYAGSMDIPVLNFSARVETASAALQTCISGYGGLLVVSAGNQGQNIDADPIYPASYNAENILVVGAIDQNNQRSIWDTVTSSNYGAASVDIYAPGTGIGSMWHNEFVASNDGTSYAAPFVTGTAALLLSVIPDLTASEVKDYILDNADTISISTPDGNQTVRKLNAGKALQAIRISSMFAGGHGTQSDPYLVSNEAQFRNIGAMHRLVYQPYGSQELIDYSFRLTNNITLTGDWTPFEYRFAGDFDGNGYSITYSMNLSQADIDGCQDQGLFGSIVRGGAIHDLTLKNCQITSDTSTELKVTSKSVSIGLLAGSISSSYGTISNVTVINPKIECRISDAHIGALAGSIQTTTVKNCVVGVEGEGGTASITNNAHSYIGGMAGLGDISKFRGCKVTITLTNTEFNADNDMMGKIVGNAGDTINAEGVEGSTNANTANVTMIKEDTCIAAGTLITLADGTQKAVEELTGSEMLLVWNMATGTLDTAPILFIDSDPIATYSVINLYFSDGTQVKVISEHGFWDYDLNEYVYLDKDAAQYIGHWFNKLSADENGNSISQKVQLVNVVIQTEYTTAYSPITYGHYCYYVNGMLSMPGGIDGMFNIFEVDAETMKYDEAQMQAEIAQYGLYTYEEFAQLFPVSEEVFEAFNGQYLKVAMGKGLIDADRLEELIGRYAEYLSEIG